MTEKSDVYKGKLGFDGRFSDALSRATPIVIDTFEDHGHDVHTFASRSTSAVQMDLDQFSVELRYRPQMKRGWKAPVSDGDVLELRIAPLFPEVCDQEIAEMLLAAVLHNLVSELSVISVKWQDTQVLLTRNQFLSAFDPLDMSAFATAEDARVPEFSPVFDPADAEEIIDDFAYWEDEGTVAVKDRPAAEQTEIATTASVIAAHDTALGTAQKRRTRPRGRSVFAPVDDTARELATHCDEILMSSYVELSDGRDHSVSEIYTGQTDKTARGSALWSVLTMPFAKATGALNMLRQSEFRHSFQILLLTVVALYLHSAGMVRAAISLLN